MESIKKIIDDELSLKYQLTASQIDDARSYFRNEGEDGFLRLYALYLLQTIKLGEAQKRENDLFDLMQDRISHER